MQRPLHSGCCDPSLLLRRLIRNAAANLASPPSRSEMQGEEVGINGEPGGARTRDHRIKSAMLYQLSYRPGGSVGIQLL